MLGDDVADMLAVPEVMSAVARRFSRSLMECYVAAVREHGRPSFAVPEHLCSAWDLPVPSGG